MGGGSAEVGNGEGIAMKSNGTAGDGERQERVEAFYQRLRGAADERLRKLAELLADKPPEEVFGKTEFQVRDVVHELGAEALQIAAQNAAQKKIPRVRMGPKRPG
jgi:hypothetical protein